MSASRDKISVRTPGMADEVAPSSWTLYRNTERLGFLTVLFLITTSHYFNEDLIAVVLEPIKHEFNASDTQLGLLTGLCFAVVYALAGFPIARWADRGNRRIVISLAVAGWNLMTALCGLAQSFGQLALARFGVGAMEPGGIPPAQSLVSDYFPPERRATATAILIYGGNGAGWLVALGLGGAVAETHGWRAALLIAGIPGLLVAALASVVLREPRYQLGFPNAQGRSESVRLTLHRLWHKRSFLLLISGLAVFSIFILGVTFFVPSFLIRSFHATLQQRSEIWGSSIAISNILGAVSGGWAADRLSRDIRWYARFPAISCLVAAPLYALAFHASSFWRFIGFQFCADCTVSAGVPVILVAVSAVSGKTRRVLATALLLSAAMLIGGALGPLFSGALSDAFHATRGTESLRHSLTAMCAFLIPAAALLYYASRAMLQDRED